MKITIKYKDYSADSAIEAIGGVPNGEVKVNDSNAATIAQPVMDDMKSGKTEENAGSRQYKSLEEYVVNPETGTRDKYAYDSEEQNANKTAAEQSITAKDEEDNTYKTSDAQEDKGQGGNLGGAISGAVVGLAAALTAAIGAEKSSTAAKGVIDVPIVGPGWAGAMMAAAGIVLHQLAKNFDKADLTKREAFKKAVSGYLDNVANRKIAIQEWCNTQKDERTAAMEEQADQAGEATEDLIAQLEELDTQYLIDVNQPNITEEDWTAIEEAYMAERAALLGEDSPVNGVLEGMGEVMELGYDDLYAQFGEAEGFANGYETIAKFLNIGKSAGNIATAIGVIDVVVGATMLVAAARMWGNAGFSNPFTFVATMASTNLGIILAATGSVMSIMAGIEMFKKASKEYACNTEGDKLRNQGVNILRQTVAEHQGFDSELMNELGELYQGANSESEETITEAESNKNGSSATTTENGEAHLTGKIVDSATGLNIGEGQEPEDDNDKDDVAELPETELPEMNPPDPPAQG